MAPLLSIEGVSKDFQVRGRRILALDSVTLAVEKGEVQAFLSADPLAYLWLKDSAYKAVASNLDGEYGNMTCCILGLRGTLVRDGRIVLPHTPHSLARISRLPASIFEEVIPRLLQIGWIEVCDDLHLHSSADKPHDGAATRHEKLLAKPK